MSGSKASLLFAVLFHDPPWKPWGITPGGIDGCGREEYWRCLVRHVERLARENLQRVNEEPLASIYKGVAKAFKADGGWVARYEEASKRDKEGGATRHRSHELQGALLARALSGALRGAGLPGLATVVEEAENLILEGSEYIRRADRLASAVDRSMLVYALGRSRDARDLVYKNIFHPDLEMKLDKKINADVIAGFILRYAEKVATILHHAVRSGAKPGEMDLLMLAFLVLESLWYRETPYPPPADTRLPTHTVFDHVNAALAAALWTAGGEKPSGCLVAVDLASVQSWIREARRLRDLWAASWLASFLAWKAVEPLVYRHGPGVLVQPPARLHPFLAASLISRLSLKGSVSDELASLLGLPYGWPVDASVPSRVLLALPPDECRDRAELQKRLTKGISEAWSAIIEEVAGLLSRASQGLGNSQQDGQSLEPAIPALAALEEFKRLPPPLPVRVIIVDVGRAFSEAREKLARSVAERIRSIVEEASRERGETPPRTDTLIDRVAEALFYPYTVLRMLPREEDRVKLRLPGRFSSEEYMQYAEKVYGVLKGRVGLCTVCGRGIEAVRGRELLEALPAGGRGSKYLSILAAEVGNDRLCPYCLTKRLLRRFIVGELVDDGYDEGKESLNSKLGLPRINPRAAEKLGRANLDLYTTRASLGRDKMKEAVKLLARAYGEVEVALAGNRDIIRVMTARNTFLSDSERKEIARDVKTAEAELEEDWVEMLESLVLEAVHDDAFMEEVLAALRNHELSHVASQLEDLLGPRGSRRYRRKYAILKLDADYMGSGVLRGALPLKSYEYASKAVNVIDKDDKNRFIELFTVLAEAADAASRSLWEDHGFRIPEKYKEVTVPPTLSYHFTVSRALAVLGMVDRLIVEKEEGYVVYSGGDDLLAVLPPFRRESDKVVPSALRAAAKARKAYWGVLVDAQPTTPRQGPEKAVGFIDPGLVDNKAVRTIASMPVAYGRSGSLYLVDSKHPLWDALEAASELEEDKDTAELDSAPCRDTGGTCKKDVLVVGSDSGGAAPLPLSMGYGRLKSVGGSLGAVELLVGEIAYETGSLSGSVVYDALHYTPLIGGGARLGRAVEARMIALSLLERNAAPGKTGEGGREAAARILDELERRLGEDALFNAFILIGGRAGGEAEATGYTSGRRRLKVELLLFPAVLAAAKIYSGSM